MSRISDYEYAVRMIDRHPILPGRPAMFDVDPAFAHVAAAADLAVDDYLDGNPHDEPAEPTQYEDDQDIVGLHLAHDGVEAWS